MGDLLNPDCHDFIRSWRLDSAALDGNMMTKNSLPVLDCNGCGACCFHMGYPAYVLPSDPMTLEEIESDPILVARIAADPKLKSELLAGREGESHWHRMPEDLRQQWQTHVNQYQLPEYNEDVSSFDGPCFWLDLETRQCKNHEYRPNICRDFETGGQTCLQWRDFYRAKIKTP